MNSVTVTVLALLFSALAHAQSYPTKPVRIIIPFPPGNSTDIMSRLIAPKMSERLGQPVIVENRPGASGMLGLDYVAKSPADGYTIACVQGGNMVVLPHTSKAIPYHPLKDFAPIAVSTTNYLAIVADPNVPFKTIGEMVAYAKANPGKLTAATPRDIVLKLNAQINRALREPDVSDKLVNAGLIIVGESPEYFAELLKSDYAKYGKLVKDIGFTPQ